MSLEKASTRELLDELLRRERHVVVTAPTEFVSCEACRNFKPVPHGDDRSNLCRRGHAMRFVPPEDHNWPEVDSWGFTRDNCGDRSEHDPEQIDRRSRPHIRPQLRKV